MITSGYALAYDGGTKDKNFDVLLERRKKWFILILLDYFWLFGVL
jgi:hypothetical protein